MVDMTTGRLWESMVDFTDLVCIGRIFSPTYNGVRFFVSIIRHERYFFSAGYFSPMNKMAGARSSCGGFQD